MERGIICRSIRRCLRVSSAAAVVALLLAWGMCGTAAAGSAGATSGVKAAPGWPGGLSSYEGRYRLTASSDASFARSGMLTIFARKVPHQDKPQMSGILALYTTDGTNVLYLTHFTHAGTKLSAQLNLGIYTGPHMGTFVLVSHHGAALVVHVMPLQGAAVLLHFNRISANPHP